MFVCRFLTTLRGHVSRVYQVSWSADSRLLCSGSSDSTIKVWDLKTKKLLYDLPGHADEVSEEGRCYSVREEFFQTVSGQIGLQLMFMYWCYLFVCLSVCPSVFHLSFHPYVCQSLNICLHIKNIHVYINKTSQMRLCLVTC